VLRAITDFFELSESEFQDQSAGGIALALLLLPVRLLWGFIVFMVTSWTTSRHSLPFLLGLPAVLFGLVAVAAIWAVDFKGESRGVAFTNHYYQVATEEGSANYDPQAALLYAKKLVELRPYQTSREFKYQLGLSYERAKKLDQAYDVMRSLAPDVEIDDLKVVSGDEGARSRSQAYFWFAKYYYNNELSKLPDDERRQLIQKNLRLAYKADPTHVLAVVMLAGVSREDAVALKAEAEKLRKAGDDIQADQKEKMAVQLNLDAERFFNEAIDLPLERPEQLYASITVIEMLQEQEKHSQARTTGLRFINKHRADASRMPNVLPFWVSLVRTCILIDEFDQAEEFLNLGYQLAQHPDVRNALLLVGAQLEVKRAEKFSNMDDEREFTERLFSLCNAIRTYYGTEPAYVELLYYIDEFDLESEKDSWLRNSIIADGEREAAKNTGISGVIHVVLGLRDVIWDDKKSGKKHWEIAGQQFLFSPHSIDMFIQIYAREKKLDSQARNDLISVAIELFPQSPQFYVTRGRYALEDEQFEKALKDLKFAEVRIPENLGLLEDLATIHEKLGDEDGVTSYRRKIEKLQARLKQNELATGVK
jgi:hypothetical protein